MAEHPPPVLLRPTPKRHCPSPQGVHESHPVLHKVQAVLLTLLSRPEKHVRDLDEVTVQRLNNLVHMAVRQGFEGFSALERVDLLRFALVALASDKACHVAVVSFVRNLTYVPDLYDLMSVVLKTSRGVATTPVVSLLSVWPLPPPMQLAGSDEARPCVLLEAATHLFLNAEQFERKCPEVFWHLRSLCQLMLVYTGQRDIFACEPPLPDPQRLLYNVRHCYGQQEILNLLEEWEVDEWDEVETDPSIVAWMKKLLKM